MNSRIVSVILVFSLVLFVSCSQIMEEHSGAAVGAGAGAATGAVVGAIAGRNVTGAIVGGLIGGLVGGAVGHYAYDKPKEREQTAKVYNYNPSQGPVLTIENAVASPQTVNPGDLVDLKLTYAVLNPVQNAETKITEIREIRHRDELVGKPEVTVTRTDGTYNSSVPLRLPANASKGDYRVITTVQSASAKDTKEMRFTVR
ncbi:MAG: glycine zipper domain-containing protein [Syntrophales bacterium LBB04]|nr:glycine zipper domain-containing protein [Syntrophales bacterium LBB04]